MWNNDKHFSDKNILTDIDTWDQAWLLEFKNATNAREPGVFYKKLLNIARAVAQRPLQSAIEIGCGGGRFMLWLSKQELDIYGFDYSLIGLQICKANLVASNFPSRLIAADFSKLPFKRKRKFDIVCSFGLIEHLTGKQRLNCIKIHADLLNKGGVVIITVPNHVSPIYQAWYRTGQFLSNASPILARKLGVNQVREEALTTREFKRLAKDANFIENLVLPSSFLIDFSEQSFGRAFAFNMPFIRLGKIDSFFGALLGLIAVKL